MSQSEDNKRLIVNTIALYLRSFIVILVTLYTSRIVLRELGVDDYGIYNVVGSIVVLFSFLNSAMTLATQRFITYEQGTGDINSTNRIFSVSLTVQAILAFVLLSVVELFGVGFLNNQLNIPEDRLVAANWVFQFSMLTFVFNMLKVPYEATVIANEKMTFFAYVSIFDVILKLLFISLLSYYQGDKLILYAFLIMIINVLNSFIYIIYCKRNFQTCKFYLVKDKPLYKQLISFSGWSLFGSATNILSQNGFVFLINIFYGVAVNAALGISTQVNSALASFINSFQTAYRPQIVKTFAANNSSRLKLLVVSTSKISFSLMIIPTLILIVNMPLVLNIWLTDVPEYTIQFCQLVLVCSVIDSITGPYFATIAATGEIKWYQVAISASFILDLIFSYLLIKLGLIPYLILLSRITTRGVLNMIIGLFFLKKQIDFPLLLYVKSCIIPIILIVSVSVCVLIPLSKLFSGWLLFLVSSFFIVVYMFTAIYYCLLDIAERETVKTFFMSKFSKIFHR